MHFEEWVRATWRTLEGREPVEADRDYTQAEIRVVLAAALQALVEALEKGGGLSLADLGSLVIQERPARRVADNLHGGVHALAARRTVRFRPSRALLRRLNGDRQEQE